MQDVQKSNKGCVLRHFSRVQLFATPWTIAHEIPLFIGFSRQEYWSGLPFPSPGIFLTQGLNPCLLYLLHCQEGFYYWHHLGSEAIRVETCFYRFGILLRKGRHSRDLSLPMRVQRKSCVRTLSLRPSVTQGEEASPDINPRPHLHLDFQPLK